MEHKERMEELFLSGNISKERMFPILNKLDKIWIVNPELQFCELVKLVVEGNKTDLELTKKLDEFIDENNIK